MLRKALLSLCLISIGATAQTRQSGNWGANSSDGRVVRGTWTAVPDSTGATVIGTYTITDSAGAKLAEGLWSAAKATTGWSGAWRANIAGKPGEFTGTWTSSTDLKDGRFNDLFEKAIQAVVSGTWRMGEKTGAWSIRAAARATPPASPPMDSHARH